MKINAVRYDNGELHIQAPPCAEIYRLIDDFAPGEYQLKAVKQKRSLSANAYAWVLIDKLSERLHIPKEEIYRRTIKEIGGVSETVCVKRTAYRRLVRTWEANGLGWQTETVDSKLDGCVNVILYYGSSQFDTAQMSALIDKLICDAKAVGIETIPPEKLEAMKGEWQ